MSWLGRLLRGRRLDGQLEAELRDHVDRLVADYKRAGMTEDAARRRARLEFGGVEQIKEQCRDARGTRWVSDVGQDLRYGLRQLRQSPLFTFIAVLSLALGIGANSAIFSLVDSVLIKTLPVREPERLVQLQGGSWTNPIWEEIRARQHELLDGAAAWNGTRFDLATAGQTEFVEGLWASGGFFDAFGVQAIIGRTFTSRDDVRGGGPDGPVAVISYDFWQRRFGGAADAIGRPLVLNRIPVTIVGVTPPGFFGPTVGRSYDVALPLGASTVFSANHWLDARGYWVLEIMGRLKPGQTVDDATAALRLVQPQIREATLPQDWPARMQETYLSDALSFAGAAAGPTGLRDRYQRPLLIVMGVVAVVLLIACANIANLLLARTASRRHELSIRLAIGASRFRIVRQLLAESLLLSTIGAALGLLLAQWGSRLLVHQLATPREAVGLDLALDWRTVAFTAGVGVATAMLFGTLPALRGRRTAPIDALKEEARTVIGRRRAIVGNPLVVAQVALSLVLVVAAGLFVRTFTRLATLDIGFDRNAILVVDIESSRTRVPAEARSALYDQIVSAVGALPGVGGVGISRITPVSGAGWNGPVELPHLQALPDRERMTFFNAVTPGWLAAYGTTLRSGRDVASTDVYGGPRVAIANETFVKRYLGEGSPLGKRVPVGQGPAETLDLEIVGVVEDAAYRSVRDPVPPVLFLPWQQSFGKSAPGAVSLSVRAASGSPALLTRAVADAALRVDRDLSLTFRPLAAYVDGALVRERLMAILSGFFGALALLLAGIGMYGTTAYAVSRRRTEIGIRMALGAGRQEVLRLVLGRVAVTVGLGVVIGAAISLWASKFAATLLYGLDARDPGTFIGAALILALTGALAAWLPARRASRIDPVRALREG